MKKFISLICIFTLVLIMALPTFSVSAAEPADIGADTMVVDGVTYKKTEFNRSSDFEDGVILNDTAPNMGITVVDFATDTGLEDADGHSKVLKIMGDTTAATNTNNRWLVNCTINGEVAVFTTDIYAPDGFKNIGSMFSYAMKNADGSGRAWTNIQQMSIATVDGEKIFRFTKADGSTVDLCPVPVGEWFNYTVMWDLSAFEITVLVDGEPIVTREKMKSVAKPYLDTIETTRGGWGAADSYAMYDNFAVYSYLPYFNVESVKGVNGDDFTDAIPYESGSQIAVKFDRPMKVSSLTNDNVILEKDGGKVVAIETIDETDYDAATNILYLTLAEDLMPSATYNITLKATGVTEDGEPGPGVVSAMGLAALDDLVVSAETTVTPYGVEDISYGSLTAGSTTTATITLRDEDAVDANLVLVLYSDGALRSISSTVIDADAIEPSYELPINVPADAGELKVCAMLMDDNYQIIDMFYAE